MPSDAKHERGVQGGRKERIVVGRPGNSSSGQKRLQSWVLSLAERLLLSLIREGGDWVRSSLNVGFGRKSKHKRTRTLSRHARGVVTLIN